MSLAFQLAGILILAFLIGLLLIFLRQPRHDGYHESPHSRVTPLGYYSAQQDGRVPHGPIGQRTYVPGDESADTVKVGVWKRD